MSGLWLAWSECEDRPRVQREIKARDHGARILWLDELQTLEDVMGSFDASIEGVALCAGTSLGADALDALGHAAGACGIRSVVLTRDLDPAWIAQLFHAGASEVVSAHGDVGERQDRGDEARAEGSSQREAETGPGPDENRGGGERPAHEELAWNAKEAAQDANPREQSAEGVVSSVCTDGFDDLDEPESEVPPRGAAARPEAPRNVPLVSSAHADDLPPWDMHPAPGPVPASRPAPVHGAVPSATAVMASGHRAPVVCALSGKGGSGVTALVTTMASCAAHLGLRTALLDLDLMFGNAYELLGVEALRDLGMLVEPAASGALGESDIVRASMRVAPGLTLWGPIAVPERAELLGRSVETLLGVLRRESDVVFVDTSRTWTDAVASTVAACERCLLVCDQSVGAASALERVISMVTRLGVPRTRMVCVVNRFGARGCTEEEAMRLEMAASLSAKARIADGGDALSSMLAFGKAEEAARSQDAFGRSVRFFSRSLLRELGCSVGVDAADDGGMPSARPRLRLPWKKMGGAL